MKRISFFCWSLLLVLAFSLSLLGCDPPHFRWPDRIPEVSEIPQDTPTPFDRWKQARLAEPNPVLVAGAAVVDLTPKNPRGMFIAGYSPNKVAMGVETPITARILILDDGRQTLGLISMDFVGYMNGHVWRTRGRISKQYTDSFLLASTHTHSGPDTVGMWGRWALITPTQSGLDKGYMARVERDIAQGVFRAIASARPAKLFVNSVEVPQGISENAHKPGHKDDIMTVLQARDLNGVPIATVVNYACHAEFLGGESRKLSADFPAYLYRALEQREGGVALFYNGPIGGIIVPAMPRHTEYQIDIRRKGAMRAGRVLAGLASRSLQQAQPLDLKEIRIERKLLSLPLGNDMFRMLGEKGIIKREIRDDKLYSEVWRVDLGALNIVSVPGEIFPSLGFAIKEMMPSKHKMILGLANDEIGYIMNAEEWQMDMYAYERTVSVGEQTGPLLLQAVRELYQ